MRAADGKSASPPATSIAHLSQGATGKPEGFNCYRTRPSSLDLHHTLHSSPPSPGISHTLPTPLAFTHCTCHLYRGRPARLDVHHALRTPPPSSHHLPHTPSDDQSPLALTFCIFLVGLHPIPLQKVRVISPGHLCQAPLRQGQLRLQQLGLPGLHGSDRPAGTAKPAASEG